MSEKKSKKKIILEKMLRFMASQIIKKYNPRIVAITGSVGKTSTKEAVFSVLSPHFRVRKNEKNYNNEIGLPLTVIGSETGGKSILKWMGVFLKWALTMFWPVEYPEILVLEMGADRKGDIGYLTGFMKPTISVLTEVSASHLEHFKTIGAVLKEKATILKVLEENDLAILNADNAQIAKLLLKPRQYGIKSNMLSYGFSENADVKAADVFYGYSDMDNEGDMASNDMRGLSFKLTYKGTTLPVRLNNILAKHNIYAAMAGISVGLGFELNLVDIAASLENFSLPPGRMSLIAGMKQSYIIDDTYNASVVSTKAALDVLGEMGGRRKIAVLGDMLELGSETEAGHKEIADKFLEIKGDIFIGVGTRMLFAVEELEKRKFKKENLYRFASPMEAAEKLKGIIGDGDIVLVKGSQGLRMEKTVEEVMLEPYKAKDLLCRQNRAWKDEPWRAI